MEAEAPPHELYHPQAIAAAAAGWDEIAGAGDRDSESLAPRIKVMADAGWERGIKSRVAIQRERTTSPQIAHFPR